MSRILMVASEATPFSKTGGLADVAGALPHALTHFGHEVAVVMPRYRGIPHHETESAFENMTVWLGGRAVTVSIRSQVRNGVTFYFVEHNDLFERSGLYADSSNNAYWDNHVRFAVLSLAALGVAQTLFLPDIIHCHDWQSALVPIYRHDQQHANPVFYGIRTVLTIHNLGYQGRFGRHVLPELGLNWGWYSADRLEYYGDVNLLKGGIVMADEITTVSARYAEEIQTPDYGDGLDGVLRGRAHDLAGILNGVDYSDWNPQTDRHIAANYRPEDLSGKLACKADLLDELGLPKDDLNRPLIGIVSRFAEQKGIDLIAAVGPWFNTHDVQLAVIGSGEARYERLFAEWQRWMPGKVGLRVGYDNRLAHKIEAGADMFLMPSRYEPCGLNQMYSLKYGTPPVVRATGGLDDTIDAETGFKFNDYNAAGLTWALDQALAAWGDQEGWRELQLAGMLRDYSWDASARKYSDLYDQLLRR